MAGKIKRMIDHLIKEKSSQDPALAHSLNAKICLKGVIPKKFTEESPDDPVVIEKVNSIANEWGVNMRGVI